MKVEEIRVCVMRVGGTNCDAETKRAFDELGVNADINHLNEIVKKASLLDYNALVFPGGFSYGDDLGAGRLWANDLYHRFSESLDVFVDEGKPVLGICNGFQALVKAGYLPGPRTSKQQVTLTFNRKGHFECRWVRLRAQPSPCLFTRDLEEDILCPVAHGEGRFVVAREAALSSS